MLKDLFPRGHRRYTSLPVLGSVLDGFGQFLVEFGYPRMCVRIHVRTAWHVDARLQRCSCRSVAQITRANLRACAPSLGRSQYNAHVAATVRLLERYFDKRAILSPPEPPSPIGRILADYSAYLQQVRGLALRTIQQHQSAASQFITHVGNRGGLSRLSRLTSRDIEDFVRLTGRRMGRGRLQHVVSELRSFLRFLAVQGLAPSGLDTQIDTPRLYREERLPRALPWETVRALLRSVDRSTPVGLRDYAMLLLIATYGLRTSEVVGLTLEAIEWRAKRLRVHQCKTAAPLWLPLTDAVGDSLTEYLRNGRPNVPYREVFVRHRTPAGLLMRTGVTSVFQTWARRSGLEIPFHGPHCLRHSYAVHLLRQGVSLKTIGDVLGHHSPESTCVYLRLSVEDLRGVALGLPASSIPKVQL
jgi:integrase/recombinase XerD